ncbi:hypothetical protein [Candidatus Venteria ishoeyi]|uniref:hypothetical protein n=1 Tax=Candidatus Venteria ishoeyi TaxID=1899563 RepID=UPI0011B089A2|nr:hypothetical protein [Candidatus Venteria ishoeyi]
MDYLQNNIGSIKFLERYWVNLEAYIMTSKLYRHDTEKISQKYSDIVNSNTATDAEKQRAEDIIKKIQGFDWDEEIGVLRGVVKKIEIASRFQSINY